MFLAGLAVLVLTTGMASSAQADSTGRRPAAFSERTRDRKLMVREQLTDITDERVLEAMGCVPRHAFVPAGVQPLAYGDHPLPIGYEQTISQPLVVAHMTEVLAVEPDHRVLELGTGSGYQAAVLGELAHEVYSVEIVPELAERAGSVLKELGYANAHVKAGDGYFGWPEHAPYDRIMITFAVPDVPLPLLMQLAPGGQLVCPLGPQDLQWVTVFAKDDSGQIELKATLPVRFVPMTGDHTGENDPPDDNPGGENVTASSTIPLPLLTGENPYPLERALTARRSVREFSDKPLTLDELARLLWAAQGVTSPDGLRTAPSAGATYPLEVFAVVERASGVEPGVYHYVPGRAPGEHRLEKVRTGDVLSEVAAAAHGQDCVEAAAAAIVIAAIEQRTAARYGDRAERYVAIEAGHAAQNILLEAVALGLGGVPVGAFKDSLVQRALRTQGKPLYILSVGHPR